MHVGTSSHVKCIQLHNRVEISLDLARNFVTPSVRGLVVTCSGPYSLRYFRMSTLNLGFGQACMLVIRNFKISDALNCVAVTICSVNQFLHTPHLPHLTILYLTDTFKPKLFNKIR